MSIQLEVILEVDRPQQAAAFWAWAEQSGLNAEALDNTGCGCCVDIYRLVTTPEAAHRLNERLRQVGSGVTVMGSR